MVFMLSSKILFHLIILFYGSKVCFSDDVPELAPEADTPSGKVSGLWKVSLGGRTYASFEGIPYALPPIGDLRFEDPQPYGTWLGTWLATQTHSCPQISFMTAGNEDCLYLNVYVPSDTMNHKKKFDVLVIIHGGAFMMGNGHQLAKAGFLIDKDIIIVTMNFRIGILGFLSTEDEVIPGNNGMKDQVLALKWVKDNIASFGGNPDAITISGISAGGASVHLHYFSPMSKGLFVRGISQSGNALDPWTIRRDAAEKAKRLGALLGCTDESSAELKKCLKQKPASLIMEKQKTFYGFGQMPFTTFGPVIEKNSKNPFLSEHPYTLLKEKRVLDVPWIVSICATEGHLPTAWYHSNLKKIDNVWPEIAHYLLDYNSTLPIDKRQEVANQIKDVYLGPGEHINEANFNKFTNMFSDRLFAIGAEAAAKLQSKVNKSPVYFYYFNYDKGVNKATSLFANTELEGVSHGEDGIYFYGFLMFKEFSEADNKMKDICLNIFYSYTTTGKPAFDDTDIWKPTEDSSLTYLNITGPDDIKLQTVEILTPTDFWRSIGLIEFENRQAKDEL